MQHAPLAGGVERVQRPPEQAGGDDQGVHLVDGAALASDVDRPPQAFGADDQLRGDREDQRRRRRDPQARGDVGHGAHQGHAQDPVRPPDPERARRLELQRIEVAGAVDRLDQQRPRGRERDQEDLALQPGAVDQDRERDQRDGRHRAQELDHRPRRVVEDLVEAQRQADRDRDRDRDREPDRVPLERVQDGAPVRALAEQVEERARRHRDRREVVARDQPDADDELDRRQRAEDAQPRQRRVGDARPRRSAGRDVVRGRAHRQPKFTNLSTSTSPVSTPYFFESSTSVFMASALTSVFQVGSVILSAASWGVFV